MTLENLRNYLETAEEKYPHINRIYKGLSAIPGK